jgi:hypothetical protein
MAAIFFTTLPNLRELCLGRQVDLQALVFHRPTASETHQLIRSYTDTTGRPKLDFPPARWAGVPCRWWASWGPEPGRSEMGVPDDRVWLTGDRRWYPRGPWLFYQEMLLDHCEVGFKEVEWLRVVRGMR